MRLVDRALPAVEHLVGERSVDVLRPVVEAAGGVIESVQPVQVQYRPGSDVVVRYSARIAWGGKPAERDTLIAASAIGGPIPGTVTVSTATPSGPLDVGVWRWPFDPVLSGLAVAVTTEGVAPLFDLPPEQVRLDVVSYRPTDRAVVRVSRASDAASDPGSVISYLKIVAPATATALVERHSALIAAGVPAPRVERYDADLGILVLEPLVGPTLRELLKSGDGEWVGAAELDRLADQFASTHLDAPPLASRLADGVLHARMLGTVAPPQRGLLDELIERFEAAPRPDADTTIHGDLHEAQLVVADGRIVGVLDIDDAGPGAAIDDRANVIARLLFRATLDRRGRTELADYAQQLRRDSLDRFDVAQLDLHTSAALVGLATGPFRMQGPRWREDVAALIERAHMRELSAPAHGRITDDDA